MKSLYSPFVWLSCFTLLVSLIPREAAAKEAIKIITARIVGVHDGDSITALAAGNVQLKVRLDGIDAPELKQPFSTQSKQALSGMVFGKVVSLHVSGQDRYKRTLAVVMVGGMNVNMEMARLGLAWWYEKYSKDAALMAAQSEARAARRGLWSDPAPIPPWEWRRR